MGYPTQEAADRAEKERQASRMGGSLLGLQPASGNTITNATREPSQMITFVYRNWHGQIRERRVIPIEVVFSHDNYHQIDQWLMHAIDMDKGARRTFAFEHMLTPIRRV